MEPGLIGAVAAIVLATVALARTSPPSRRGQAGQRTGSEPPRRSTRRRRSVRAPRHLRPPEGTRPYPGDFTGTVRPVYAPKPDGRPDPGEIVWTWVAFEDDPSRGKDRPVLLIGRDHNWLLALMLTSQDHVRPGEPAQTRGPQWLDIGTGAWDARRRPSEVRLDRIIRVHPDDVRREGAVLDRARFDQVAHALESLALGPDR